MNNLDLIDFSQDLEGFNILDGGTTPTGFECPICLTDLGDAPYAMIDNTAEKGRYHVECLELWLNRSRNGILTQDKVFGYTVYHEAVQIETVRLPPLRKERSQYYQENNNIRRRTGNNDDEYCCLCTLI